MTLQQTADDSDGLHTSAPLLCSVIIPALNEETNVARAIASARDAGADEVIVVDGGSNDDTLRCAEAADLVLSSDPGRSLQQNTGAAHAQGDILLFLHADSWLAANSVVALKAELNADEETIAGCFCQRIDGAGRMLRLVERGNRWRARVLKWCYGDQAIFVRRHIFQSVGGFPALRFMEDLYLMKTLKRLPGEISVVKNAEVFTSARRWQSTGVIRRTCRNWLLIALAHTGISPNRLASWY